MGAESYTAAGITVFAGRQELVSQVTRFVMPQIFPLFGLPISAAAAGPDRDNQALPAAGSS
jgi:hypothetical protein